MEGTESVVALRSRSVKEVRNCVKASGSAGYRDCLRPLKLGEQGGSGVKKSLGSGGNEISMSSEAMSIQRASRRPLRFQLVRYLHACEQFAP